MISGAKNTLSKLIIFGKLSVVITFPPLTIRGPL